MRSKVFGLVRSSAVIQLVPGLRWPNNWIIIGQSKIVRVWPNLFIVAATGNNDSVLAVTSFVHH